MTDDNMISISNATVAAMVRALEGCLQTLEWMDSRDQTLPMYHGAAARTQRIVEARNALAQAKRAAAPPPGTEQQIAMFGRTIAQLRALNPSSSLLGVHDGTLQLAMSYLSDVQEVLAMRVHPEPWQVETARQYINVAKFYITEVMEAK